jgi:hypothetical protein
LIYVKPPFLLLKSLFQHRGRLNIKIKENAEKILSFFFNQMIIEYKTILLTMRRFLYIIQPCIEVSEHPCLIHNCWEIFH